MIADDQKIVRDGLVSLIALLPAITVVGAAVDGDDAVRLALERESDVVLTALNMPRCNGIEATGRLRGHWFAVGDGPAVARTAEPPDVLTPREAEVLAQIAAGRSNAEIARR